jgi:hypothetical protein
MIDNIHPSDTDFKFSRGKQMILVLQDETRCRRAESHGMLLPVYLEEDF